MIFFSIETNFYSIFMQFSIIFHVFCLIFTIFNTFLFILRPTFRQVLRTFSYFRSIFTFQKLRKSNKIKWKLGKWFKNVYFRGILEGKNFSIKTTNFVKIFENFLNFSTFECVLQFKKIIIDSETLKLSKSWVVNSPPPSNI